MRAMLELVYGSAQACVSRYRCINGDGDAGDYYATAFETPKVGSSLPNLVEHTVMLDLGCNVNCTSEMLWQFACIRDLPQKLRTCYFRP